MYPRPDGIINVTAAEVADARLATEDVPLVRSDGTLTPAGVIYVSDSRRAAAAETTHALDVWVRFDSDAYEHDEDGYHDDDDDEEPSHEANTFRDGDRFRVEWYHTAVGQVSSRYFDTYADARTWLISQGFSDFSS